MLRRAVASFEAGMTSEELDQLANLADQVEQSAARMKGMIDHAVTAVDQPVDEIAMRVRVAEREK